MENFLLWYFVLREFTNKEICVTMISFFRSLCDENLNKKGKSPYKEICATEFTGHFHYIYYIYIYIIYIILYFYLDINININIYFYIYFYLDILEIEVAVETLPCEKRLFK